MRSPGPAGYAVVSWAGGRAHRLEQLVRLLHTPVTLDDGRTVDVAASVGATRPRPRSAPAT